MTVSLPILTASRLKAFRRCERLHHLRYVLGYRAVEEVDALRFGTLVHAALQRWWEAQLPVAQRQRIVAAVRAAIARATTADEERMLEALTHGEPLEAASAAIAVATAGAMHDGAAVDQVKAELLITGYHHRWIDADLEVLAVEAEFRLPLLNPATGAESRTYVLGGKIDALVRERRTGRVLVVEHKTSAETFDDGSVYRTRLKLNNQISVYFRGAVALGFAPAACLYDVIGKPTIRPLKATPIESRKYTKDGRLYANQRDADETPAEYGARLREHVAERPEDYFARFEVVRLEAEIAEHAADLWQTALAIRQAERAGRGSRNDDACFAYGRACEFLRTCVGEASLDDSSRYVRSDDVHPELGGA